MSATVPQFNGIDRGLPANVNAERTLLGAILLDNDACIECAEHLEADDFSLDSHQRIYMRMLALYKQKHAVDIVTLANELARFKEIEAIGGVAYLASLTEGLPRRLAITEYLTIVKDKARLRRLMGIGHTLVARAADQQDAPLEIAESLAEHMQQMLSVSNGGKLIRARDFLIEHFPTPACMLEKAGKNQGVKTGFEELDRMAGGGLQRQELIIVAARPSMGKTAFAVNVCQRASIDYGLTVALFSLEMSRESILARSICCRGLVPYQRYKKNELNTHELSYFTSAHDDLADAEFYIDDTAALALSQIRNSCRALKARPRADGQPGKLDMVMIDHLGLMSAAGAPQKYNRQQEVGWLTAGLKALAKELDVPVVLLCQLSRANTQRADKRPVLSDLRESGNIEQDGDLIAFLHREEYYDPANESLKGQAEIIIAKQRNGPTGTVHVAYNGPIMRWSDPAQAVDAQSGLWGAIK